MCFKLLLWPAAQHLFRSVGPGLDPSSGLVSQLILRFFLLVFILGLGISHCMLKEATINSRHGQVMKNTGIAVKLKLCDDIVGGA